MKNNFNDIFNSLLELSDTKIQRQLWLNENNDTGLVSSFVELYCRLFDDFGFDEFIDFDLKRLGKPNSVVADFQKLRDLMNAYKVGEKILKEIIIDDKWIEVVTQAKVVVKHLESKET